VLYRVLLTHIKSEIINLCNNFITKVNEQSGPARADITFGPSASQIFASLSKGKTLFRICMFLVMDAL